jgi:hypothetical protein
MVKLKTLHPLYEVERVDERSKVRVSKLAAKQSLYIPIAIGTG